MTKNRLRAVFSYARSALGLPIRRFVSCALPRIADREKSGGAGCGSYMYIYAYDGKDRYSAGLSVYSLSIVTTGS